MGQDRHPTGNTLEGNGEHPFPKKQNTTIQQQNTNSRRKTDRERERERETERETEREGKGKTRRLSGTHV